MRALKYITGIFTEPDPFAIALVILGLALVAGASCQFNYEIHLESKPEKQVHNGRICGLVAKS